MTRFTRAVPELTRIPPTALMPQAAWRKLQPTVPRLWAYHGTTPTLLGHPTRTRSSRRMTTPTPTSSKLAHLTLATPLLCRTIPTNTSHARPTQRTYHTQAVRPFATTPR